MMEELSQDTDGGGLSVKVEEVENENLTEMAALDADDEDEEALPHSEILDIFEEGLAQLVQDPLLCDLPIQVGLIWSDTLYISQNVNLVFDLSPSPDFQDLGKIQLSF